MPQLTSARLHCQQDLTEALLGQELRDISVYIMPMKITEDMIHICIYTYNVYIYIYDIYIYDIHVSYIYIYIYVHALQSVSFK